MTSTLLRWVVLAACLRPLALSAQNPPARDNNAPGVGTGVIRGRVVDATNGDPLRGARVYADGNDGLATLTDGSGRYEITAVPAGRYRLTARTNGYLVLDFGQTRPAQAGKAVVVADKQVLENVNFALPLGGSIAGVVRDANGDAMANVQVRALRPVYREGRKVLNADVIVFTNDLGAYRLFGLLPGSFYLSVLAPNPSLPSPFENTGAGLAPTYFPGTSSFADAQRVAVKLGETTNNVDVVVVPVNNGAIRGRLLDEDGRPLTNSQMSVSQVGPGLLFGNGVRPQADGSFSVQNLAPGSYEVRATGVSSTSDRTPLIANGRLTVTAAQTLDLALTATRMSTGSGRLAIDSSTAARPSVAAIQLQLDPGMVPGAVPYQARGSGSLTAIRILPDSTFTLQAQPGRSVIIANALPRGWYVKGVRVKGVDQSDGIDFPVGGKVEGIEIELTDHPSEIIGTARTANGQSLADYAVLVFAQDMARRTGLTRYFGSARSEADGSFKVFGLPPGDYFAVALEYADPEVSADPDFLQTLAREAMAFTLGDGEVKRLDLTRIQ